MIDNLLRTRETLFSRLVRSVLTLLSPPILQAEEGGYFLERDYDYGEPTADSDSDPDYGRGPKRKSGPKKKKQRGDTNNNNNNNNDHQHVSSSPTNDDLEVTATGRKKRKDVGQVRAAARSWTDEEEVLFQEALTLYGRDWKKCAEHVKTRDYRAISSHAQKYLIKMLLKGEPLPEKMVESGGGYTLSGKPLDPNSAAARAYGLRKDAFVNVVAKGVLEVGVHVTTLEMADGDASSGGGGGTGGEKKRKEPAAKKQKRKEGEEGDDGPTSPSSPAQIQNKNSNNDNNNDNNNTCTHTELVLDHHQQEEFVVQEPTEYAKNRPRRHITSTRATLGETNESLDLTHVYEFVGPVATGAPLSQPFSVTLSSEALFIMDFHAHLSLCEIIGILGGTVDHAKRTITVKVAHPCRRTEGSNSTTSVEVDAVAMTEAQTELEAKGMTPVGWYHSHPIFEPRPSVKDNENQRNYQSLCRDENTGLEPWVGAIVGPYDQALPSPMSRIQLWTTRKHGQETRAYHLRHSRVKSERVPEVGGGVEEKIKAALRQIKEDPSRMKPRAIWRSFTRVVQGSPEGDHISFGDKLQIALRAHLPMRERPEEVAAFMGRVRGFFREEWGEDVPELAVTLPREEGEVKNVKNEDTKDDTGVAPLVVVQEKSATIATEDGKENLPTTEKEEENVDGSKAGPELEKEDVMIDG